MRGRENAARAAAVYSYAAMALLGAVITIVNSTQGRLSEHYGVPANRITLLISCIGVGRLLIQVVCGALSDRFGRKTIVLAGFSGMAVFFAAMPFVTTLTGGMLMCVFCGISYGMVNTTMLALIFDCYAPTGKTDAAQVRVQTVYAVGAILVPLGSSVLLANGLPWQTLYWACACVSLAMILVKFFVSFPPLAVRTVRENGYTGEPKMKREGLLLLLATFCLYGAHTMGLTWISVLAQENTSMAPAEAVFVLSILNIGALVGSLLITRLLRRLSNLRLLLIAPAAGVICYGVCVLTRQAGLFRLFALAAGMCTGSLFNLLVGVAGHMFPKISGTVSGMMSTSSAAASLVIPALTGWLADISDVRIMFSTVFILLAGGIFVVLALTSRDRKLRGTAP